MAPPTRVQYIILAKWLLHLSKMPGIHGFKKYQEETREQCIILNVEYETLHWIFTFIGFFLRGTVIGFAGSAAFWRHRPATSLGKEDQGLRPSNVNASMAGDADGRAKVLLQ